MDTVRVVLIVSLFCFEPADHIMSIDECRREIVGSPRWLEVGDLLVNARKLACPSIGLSVV